MMLVQEMEQYFKHYQLETISFQKAVTHEENTFIYLNLSLYFTYKKRPIHINFFLTEQNLFNIHKDIPTKNKKVIKEVEELIFHVLSYIGKESCYRLVTTYTEATPEFTGKPYNYVFRKIKEKTFIPRLIMAYLVPILFSLFISVMVFKHNLLMGIISLFLPFFSVVFTHWLFVYKVDKGINSIKRAKEKIRWSLTNIAVVFILIILVETL